MPGASDIRRAPAPKGLAEQMADALGGLIVEGRLRPGDRLTEGWVAERFGTSRGPAREAMRLLDRRRLVETRPRRGAHVRALSRRMIADLFDVRGALAGLAAATMAVRPDPGWLATLERRLAELEAGADDPGADPVAYAYTLTRAVRAVVRGSGNEAIVHIFEDLDAQSLWTTIWQAPLDCADPSVRRARAAAIRAVRDAVAEGRGEAARAALAAMMEATRDSALAVLAEQAPAGLAGPEADAEAP